MAQAKRNDIDHGDPVAHAAADDHRYDAGGHVARLQADLARRLIDTGTAARPVAPETAAERLIRRCSTVGGYGALLAGYVAVAAVIACWL